MVRGLPAGRPGGGLGGGTVKRYVLMVGLAGSSRRGWEHVTTTGDDPGVLVAAAKSGTAAGAKDTGRTAWWQVVDLHVGPSGSIIDSGEVAGKEDR